MPATQTETATARTENKSLTKGLDYATKGDVIAASKAVHDELRDHIKTLDTSVAITVGKALESRLDKRLEGEVHKALEAEYVKRLQSLETGYQQKVMDMQGAFEKQLLHAKSLFETKLLEAAKGFDSRVDFIQQAHRQMMQEFSNFIQSLPVPNVSVTVPEQAPPGITVNVPEQKAPTIEVKSPDVVVNLPPGRRTAKDISYDEYGRPVHIEEREVE